MKKFVVLYYSPPKAMEKMGTASPEEMQAEQAKWMEWFKSVGEDLVDMGEYFSQGAVLDSNGYHDCTGKVTGYSIIQAEMFEEAKEIVKNHPHVGWFEGCTVEVYEPMQMG